MNEYTQSMKVDPCLVGAPCGSDSVKRAQPVSTFYVNVRESEWDRRRRERAPNGGVGVRRGVVVGGGGCCPCAHEKQGVGQRPHPFGGGRRDGPPPDVNVQPCHERRSVRAREHLSDPFRRHADSTGIKQWAAR